MKYTSSWLRGVFLYFYKPGHSVSQKKRRKRNKNKMHQIKVLSFYRIALVILFLLIISISGFSQELLFPVTLTDASGVTTTLTEKPLKIISAAPSNTEIIFALGLEDKLVGRSDFCNYPPETEKRESIGKMFPLNLEKIISLEPDIILAFGELNQIADITRLRELGFKVLVIQAESLEETLQSIKLISLACGIPERGNQLISHIQERIDRITSRVAMLSNDLQPKVFAGSSFDTIYSPGRGTLFHELITLAGGRNIIGHLTRWVKINPELVTQAEPDIILIPSGIMNPEEVAKIKNDIIHHPGWSQVPAIRNNRIYTVNEDLFYRAGPRLVDGLELLYEIFTKTK
jgi:iron complex transport system substrate-binding protein